ncbi:MAG: lipoyl synthase, partial [Fluviibacter sp.]
MNKLTDLTAPSRSTPESHQRNAEKLKRIPIKVEKTDLLTPKPAWIRTRLGDSHKVGQIKRILREHQLHSVCEEASCPNLSECFSHGTATFMILGDLCTRRCPFCDVAHGRPKAPNPNEPKHLAETIRQLKLKYVVITSVNRDDLPDGGAEHFAKCINSIRYASPNTRIEVLTPDFRGRQTVALRCLQSAPPDVFNHNLETVPRLYKAARPGSDYHASLTLLQTFKSSHPHVPTKSGLMLGLGEVIEEIVNVLSDLRAHGCEMLTLGQYLQPSL